MKQTTERESLLSTLSEVTAGILSNNNHQHINTSSTISSHGVTPSVLNTPSVAVLVDQQSTTSYTQAPVATYTHTQVHTQANIDSVHSYLSPTTQKPSPVGTSDDNKSMTNTSNLNTSAISIRGSKPTVSFETNTPSSYVPATPTQSTSVSANKQNDISSNNKSSSSIYTNHATTPTTVPSTNYPLVEQAVQPVSQRQLQEELQLLRYDLHKELQTVIREQRREIEFAKVS